MPLPGPSDQDETLESRAEAAGQMAATRTQRVAQEGLVKYRREKRDRGRVRHGLHPPSVDRPLPLREKQPVPGDGPTGAQDPGGL